jgi:N-acetylmuramoyl-L-alanine amidase CwlA
MQIIGKGLTLDEFRRYAKEYDYGTIKPSGLVIHHTWKPTKAEWRGDVSIEGLRKYYESKGWATSAHLFIAEDGVWLFTPMKDVGIHAGAGNATYSFGRLKSYTLGIEVVGDYDAEKWSGKTKENALGVIKILMSHLKIPTEGVTFHRDWMPSKTCPGASITKDWLFAELAKLDSDGNFVSSQGQPSEYAKEAWQWFKDNNFDGSVSPGQNVSAEAVAVYLKKLHDLLSKKGK